MFSEPSFEPQEELIFTVKEIWVSMLKAVRQEAFPLNEDKEGLRDRAQSFVSLKPSTCLDTVWKHQEDNLFQSTDWNADLIQK